MSLRTKFLISYVAILIVISAGAFATIRATGHWRTLAREQVRANAQHVTVGRLQRSIERFTQANRDVLDRTTPALNRLDDLTSRIETHILELRRGVQEGPEAEFERDMIVGFEEAYRELLWIAGQVRMLENETAADSVRWHTRLSDIDDEVADAATALEQYIRDQIQIDLARAERAGSLTTITAFASVAGTAILVLAMIFLLHRWVTRPVADLEAAADAVGAGSLDIDLPYHPEREWRKISDALRHMTRSLALTQQQLRTSERLGTLGEVASYVAHNIRNPLASIRAMAQAGLLEADQDPAREEMLRDMIQCVDKMEAWVARLLGYARPLTLEPERLDINTVVREMVDILDNVSVQKRVTLAFKEVTGLPPVDVDPPLFEQALSAIVSNSIDATPAGGRVTIDIRPEPGKGDPNWISVIVTDTGPGIKPDLLPDVFLPYVSSKESGSGLGLAQAKKIIDLHLGRIDIASTPGEGTRVTIRLPAILE